MFKLIHDWVKENTIKSGTLSSVLIGGAIVDHSILHWLFVGFQVVLGILGGTVSAITIYTFLEKKGLLPKWFILKDKENKNNGSNSK